MDETKAARLFEEDDPINGMAAGLTRPAEDGIVKAQLALAALYGERGEMEPAVRWIQKAAESGNPEAIFLLAQSFAAGAGGLKQDDAKANSLYRKAAESGYELAWLYLAFNAANGNGMDKNFAQARKFLETARNSGFDEEKVRVALANIDRREVADAEYERAQAESNRQQAEAERQRARACDHVYVGKTFNYLEGVKGWFGSEMNVPAHVTGVSPAGGRASITFFDPFLNKRQSLEVPCSVIP
jgi:TPR repeat protein